MRRTFQAGSSLAAVMIMVAILGILSVVAVRQWSHVIQREKERELIYRGQQIRFAIQEFQIRNGRPPNSLEELTKPPKPLLRREWPDPMTARYDRSGELLEGTGEWELLHPDARQLAGQRTLRDKQQDRRRNTPGPLGEGVIIGVTSKSEELSISRFERVPPGSPYSQWRFEVFFQSAATGQTGGRIAIAEDLPRPPGFGGIKRPPGAPPPPRPGQLPPNALPGGGAQRRPRGR